jgi:replication-associated recombination protein RarA
MKYKLFWEKHRPKNINDVVLLPRIRKAIQNGVTQNLLMYGGPGCGKTTLSRIIAKLYPSYSINASKQSSVDMLRNQIDKFCSTVDMMFDTHPVKELIEEIVIHPL